MDLSTEYMGIKLKSPIVLSSSHITNNIKNIVEADKHGAGAVVLKSLFEEQILADVEKLYEKEKMYFWYKEAIEYMDELSKTDGISQYINLIKEAKSSVQMPVIASINCTTPHEWPKFTEKIEEAGADGIELNMSIIPSDVKTPCYVIQERYESIIKEVLEHTNIPISIKIGPYFSNVNMAIRELSDTSVKGIVLFNRFYRPDIDIERLEVVSDNFLSSASELTHTLRWVALLSHEVKCDLAASSGIHDHEGVIKMMLAGAKACEMTSTFVKNGIPYIQTINEKIAQWMERKNFRSIKEFQGLIAKREEYTPQFERVQYMKRNLESFHKRHA